MAFISGGILASCSSFLSVQRKSDAGRKARGCLYLSVTEARQRGDESEVRNHSNKHPPVDSP